MKDVQAQDKQTQNCSQLNLQMTDLIVDCVHCSRTKCQNVSSGIHKFVAESYKLNSPPINYAEEPAAECELYLKKRRRRLSNEQHM